MLVRHYILWRRPGHLICSFGNTSCCIYWKRSNNYIFCIATMNLQSGMFIQRFYGVLLQKFAVEVKVFFISYYKTYIIRKIIIIGHYRRSWFCISWFNFSDKTLISRSMRLVKLFSFPWCMKNKAKRTIIYWIQILKSVFQWKHDLMEACSCQKINIKR